MDNNGEFNAVYQRYLVDFMGFRAGVTYERNATFREEELMEVVPEEVLNWMTLRTFGVANVRLVPGGQAFLIRSSTLEVMKKAVFFYMPDRVAAWNTRCRSGNHTRSKGVNDFIKYVKKQEVRRIGKSSNAKRPINMAQFREAIKNFELKKDFVNRYCFTTMMKFQYHLIA